MKVSELLSLLRQCPIIASVQADEGSPLDDPLILAKLALASQSQGCTVLRMQGVDNIRAGKHATGMPVIGLIKRRYPSSDVYITPTKADVQELIDTECEIIAMDATPRNRPNGEQLSDLVELCHAKGRLVLGDCDSIDSVHHAVKAGCDLVSTTLSGYTPNSPPSKEPDLRLITAAAKLAPTLAEGRYSEQWQVRAAISGGATGVVIGGAINDPIKNTRKFVEACPNTQEDVAAFDLGGTWLRFARVTPDFEFHDFERIPLPQNHEERLQWMQQRVDKHALNKAGISAGGVICANQISDAKGFISDYIGNSLDLGVRTFALNDGLATAWAHAQHPEFIGSRVGTLALGSGVGAGVADQRRVFVQRNGNYPRINDLYLPDGRTVEETLGGLQLDKDPMGVAPIQIAIAYETALRAIMVAAPDLVVLCGGVGLSEKYRDIFVTVAETLKVDIAFSPFGEKAGLAGAAALSIYPPDNFVS
ncbi:putative N-acetylmannosamine-6-phosphate 2-epimerase [Kamptonema cortianum]|nr:putative N-acetylmannosamine-6-phosphate 2-epimerase [Geitlerinema splendidum]MDK3161192.1 putative N-acetylmannosamine-6-phosphate 2-epimerase [Kamptonema cortianum]